MARSTKGNRARPAQGNNSNKPWPQIIRAGGDNVNTGRRAPIASNNKPKRTV